MHATRPTSLAARAAALALLAACLPAAPLAAQDAAEDQGTFRVSVGGHPVGTEEFTIRQTGVDASAEILAVGNVSLTLPTGTLELTPRLRASGLGADPVAYEVGVGGDSPRRIVGQVAGGRFSARIVSPAGEQMREYVASAGATILDEGIAHHYYFLARRLRSGRVPILVPRENRQVMATVTDRGVEPVEVHGATVSLSHLVVQPDGGEVRHVWVDAQSRVIRVDVPERQYSAVRTALPR